MAKARCPGALYLLLLSLIINSWLLVPIQADDPERKVYIVYMGDLEMPDIDLGDVYLNMTKAAEYLMYTFKNFKGFVAHLTDNEADIITKMDGVVSVFPNVQYDLQTTRSWDFMGFPLDVKRSSGESDVIIGVFDTGIWPESESFSDEGFGPPPAKWKGSCDTTLNFTCNNKLIGAKYFRVEGNITEADIASPRDIEGHGTHTASTAAGVVVEGASFLGLGEGSARGGVPSARIAVYKVCWTDILCGSANVLAAFDAAISDGVDIISASFGSSKFLERIFQDASSIGAFHAMQKGILTSKSAGNDGPTLQTLGNDAPWFLSVAASSIDRKFITQIKLDNGLVVQGISLNTFDLQNKTFPLIYGGDAQNATSEDFSRTCFVDSLNNTLVKGKIVVCDGGGNGEGAFLAGAAGVIMQGLDRHDTARVFPIPASYLQVADATPVLSYARNLTSTPYGTIIKSVAINYTSAPVVASFSSRGPNSVSLGILKPDLTAPGINILAATSPLASPSRVEGDPRRVAYAFGSGTSMSCPHATGVAAYVKSFHPTWSPAAIKSALMTTAFPMSSTANEEAEFAYGSGHINPLKAVKPGLVYDAGEDDYIKFLCGEGLNELDILRITRKITVCTEKSSNWDLNYPSMAFPTTAGAFDVTFKRTVTNVGSANSTYSSVVSKPVGQAVGITVQPNALSFDTVGQKMSFTVRVTGSIGVRTLISASLVWDDGEHHVRSPVVVYNLS